MPDEDLAADAVDAAAVAAGTRFAEAVAATGLAHTGLTPAEQGVR